MMDADCYEMANHIGKYELTLENQRLIKGN